MSHWVVYEDESTVGYDADHFSFDSAHLTLTRWTLVLLQPREVVVRRLQLRGTRPIRGVLTIMEQAADDRRGDEDGW